MIVFGKRNRNLFVFGLTLLGALAFGILAYPENKETMRRIPRKTDLPVCFQFEPPQEIPIPVTEPSGIAYNPTDDNLLVSSDEGGVFIIAKDGSPVQLLAPLAGDLEGLAFDPEKEALLVAEERERQVIALAPTGEVILVMPIDLLGYNEEDNKGIEGIALNSKTGDLFVSKQKDPNFIIRIGLSNKITPFQIEGLPDISDLHYDYLSRLLWVLSREARTIYFINDDLEMACKPFEFGIDSVDGLTRDKDGVLYLVADRGPEGKDSLYVLAPRKKISI